MRIEHCLAPNPLYHPHHLQVIVACLRLDDQSHASDDQLDKTCARPESSATHRRSSGEAFPAGPNVSASSGAENLPPPTTAIAVVEFMGGADANAEELAALTGASASCERNFSTPSGGERLGKMGEDNIDGSGADLLELCGGALEHVGLPKDRLVDILLWAQRQVAGADGSAVEWSSSGSTPEYAWIADDGQGSSSSNNKIRPEERAAAERTVATVTLGVLQGMLIGELPRGFAASVVNSSDRREQQEQDPTGTSPAKASAAGTPFVSPPRDVPLDPFFLETLPGEGRPDLGSRSSSWRQRGRGGLGDSGTSRGGGAAAHSRSRPRRNNGRTKPLSTTSITLPLLIRLPEAFPALCQQVATAPQGAAPRWAVMETIVAAVQSRHNAKAILSVDSWQQYLLSVVSSAQGRQAVATSAASTASRDSCSTAATSCFASKKLTGSDRASAVETAEDGNTGTAEGSYDGRSAADEAMEEERLVDQTVRLICWLAIYEAREGKPGRPGAGFAALQDTISFLRCQAELGTMECVSVGARMLRHMVSTGLPRVTAISKRVCVDVALVPPPL